MTLKPPPLNRNACNWSTVSGHFPIFEKNILLGKWGLLWLVKWIMHGLSRGHITTQLSPYGPYDSPWNVFELLNLLKVSIWFLALSLCLKKQIDLSRIYRKSNWEFNLTAQVFKSQQDNEIITPRPGAKHQNLHERKFEKLENLSIGTHE